MQINATAVQTVIIDPKEVIQKLLNHTLSHNHWIFKENDKYYEGFEQSAGSHSYDDKIEITKERYEYIRSLQIVLKTLKNS